MNAFARCCTLATLAFTATLASAQMAPMTDHGVSVGGKPLASPPAVAETTLDGKKITIHYNSPSKRGRVIFGNLVPFDHWWRTGANPATSFVTETALKIGTLDVPAGAYTLYTLPEAGDKPWMLILNKQTGQWGTVYDPTKDLGRTEMSGGVLAAPQEAMSITFEDVHGKHAVLHIRWDMVDESVMIEKK